MTDREACIVLNMISGIGYARYRKLCDAFGSPSAALEQSAETLLTVPGLGEKLAEKIANWRNDVNLDDELAFAARAGVRIFTLYDEAYPAVLRQLHDPPLVLYVRGVLPEFGQGNALAVVGTRRVSRYGKEITALLTADAVAAGMVIVSGLALGVDTVAHWTAVEKGGITVAVLGGGLACLQPQENLPLARKIIESGGAVISEFPMRFPVNRTSFPRRNRIVARLSDGVLVTEAGEGSGALITANVASDFVPVMAVPGQITNPQSRGCHQLLRTGAALVENFTDIAEAIGFGMLPLFGNLREPEALYEPGSSLDLPPDARRVLELLRERGELSYDALAAETALDSGALTAAVMHLELMMLIRRSADQIFSAIRAD